MSTDVGGGSSLRERTFLRSKNTSPLGEELLLQGNVLFREAKTHVNRRGATRYKVTDFLSPVVLFREAKTHVNRRGATR